MSDKSTGNQDRIIAYRDDASPEYATGRAAIPIRESSFVQIGRGEHVVDVSLATVGDIGLLRTGIGVQAVGINVLNPDYIGFALPVSWTGDLLINGQLASRSNVYMPGELDSLHLRSKSRVMLGVTMPRAPFVETIAALRGMDPGDVRLGDRELCLPEAAGAQVRAGLTAIINEACGQVLKRSPREIGNEVTGLLADAFLHALPDASSRTGRISRPERIVRLAEERFVASANKRISLADLCAAAGVQKSTLYKAFHSVCGLSPIAYFHKRRLMHARSFLVNATSESTRVKHAALGAGFTELGRFAVEYRCLFGESPSATLCKGKD